MQSDVCTLFEGSYHYGVAALVNSLVTAGFKGSVWAGYRGALPPWAAGLQARDGYSEMRLESDCRLCFVPVETALHFTNFKPAFMLDLWERFCPEGEALFYFDPDITVRPPWSMFEEWVRCGVALCEDLNSPFNPTHPLRLRWKHFFAVEGFTLNSPHSFFVNGGFLGVARKNQEFVEQWRRVLEIVSPHAGDLKKLCLGDRSLLFQIPDQDALNITVYSTSLSISVIGQEGMDFRPGGYTMSHAAGSSKPWAKKLLWSALQGVAPSLADKNYWGHTDGPLRPYTPTQVRMKRTELAIAAALGRFIRRS